MAISDTQKTDFLWKRVNFGVTDTDLTGKEGFNETIPSPIPTYNQEIWAESAQIPTTPAAVANVVQEYAVATALQCTEDPTVAGGYAWLATSSQGDASSRVGDWIAPTFDPQYLIGVYDGDPNSGGSSLNQGSAGDEWVFDYIAGVVQFPNGPPSGTSEIWLVGYRYIGQKGISTGGAGSGSVQIYADNTARDADANVVTGDMAYVTSAPDGEYAVYVALTDGPAGTWSLVATEDSAGSDAKSLISSLAFNTGASTVMGNASQGTRVVNTMVEVTTAFDGSAEVEVGVSGTTDAICAPGYVDLQTVGTYQVSSNYEFTSATDTDVLMTYTAGGATQGAATVTVTFA
jgi:hypothetical protein